jgi:hypothetical protein
MTGDALLFVHWVAVEQRLWDSLSALAVWAGLLAPVGEGADNEVASEKGCVVSDRPQSYDGSPGGTRSPKRSPRARASLVAAAAVLALVGGAVAVMSGRGQPDHTAPPPTAPRPPAVTTSASPPTTAPTRLSPTTESTTTTTAVTTTASEAERLSVLRPDGLGPFDFAGPVDPVVAWLADQLRAPDAAIAESGQGGWPLSSCAERRFAYWSSAGLTVGFTDFNGIHTATGVPDCDDGPHFSGWYVVAERPWFAPDHTATDTAQPPVTIRLTTADGIGLGSTVGELRDADPTVVFGDWDVGEYAPDHFRTAAGMQGRVTWNPIGDVQRALNERGADLVVDGVFGPRTRTALTEFQIANGVTEPHDVLGPQTLTALDVTVPDSAPVEYLQAGSWEWGF